MHQFSCFAIHYFLLFFGPINNSCPVPNTGNCSRVYCFDRIAIIKLGLKHRLNFAETFLLDLLLHLTIIIIIRQKHPKILAVFVILSIQ